MPSGFDCDIDAAAAWPLAVDVEVRVDYPNGPPEYSRLRIAGFPLTASVASTASAGSTVGVSDLRAGAPADAPTALCWTELPGRTLFLRCLHVLAVHLFGSVDMPPRIVGRPLWTALTLDLALAADDPQALHLNIRATGAGRAQLRWRLHRDQPIGGGTATLDPLDADPLRAVLRLGIACRIAPRQRPAGRGATSPARPQRAGVAISSDET